MIWACCCTLISFIISNEKCLHSIHFISICVPWEPWPWQFQPNGLQEHMSERCCLIQGIALSFSIKVYLVQSSLQMDSTYNLKAPQNYWTLSNKYFSKLSEGYGGLTSNCFAFVITVMVQTPTFREALRVVNFTLDSICSFLP